LNELPSGTVTFLFTDIEGSTALLKQLGRDGYDEVLAEHSRLLKAAFGVHKGRVVDTQGDSFFVAFRTAADAVGAAVDAQRDLAAQRWPDGAEVKVRMGLHTGEPKVGEARYVGIGVHRAARIGAAGHGGQILLSSATKEVAEEDLPPGVTIKDLGSRRLKDIDQPQRIYQLDVAGLQSKFAELKTLDVELKRKKRRMYAGSALIGVIAAAVAIPIFAFAQGGSTAGVSVQGNAVAVIDPSSNRVTGQIPVGARPEAIAFGAGGLWVSNLDDSTVSHVDPTTDRAVRAIPTGNASSGLAAGEGAVWAISTAPGSPFGVLRRIDPRFDVVAKRIRVHAGLNPLSGEEHLAGVATGPGSVWVGTDSGLLDRVDPSRSAVSNSVDTGNSPEIIAQGAGAVWVADPFADNVVRVDPATNTVSAAIPVGSRPIAVAVGAGAVWVADRGDDRVARIDPDTNTVTATINVGRSPTGIAVGNGAVWVANSRDGTVSRIDPPTNTVVKTVPVGGSPRRIAAGGGRVWVTVQSAVLPAETAQAGGVIRIDSEEGIDFLDPALAYYAQSWSIEQATCARLLNYPDRPAPAGSRLEPEVAVGLPARSADGRAYTFTIRRGFRFSPPSNEPVTARTFQYTIERTLSPKIKSPGRDYADDIVGAQAYEAGKAGHISGVTARGNRLTIRLTRPAADFLTRISTPFFCAVPLGTPVDPKGVRVVPSAGPYYVASFTPGQGAVLRRNPNYRGSRPHRLGEIDYRLGVGKAQSVKEIEAGDADFAADGVPPQTLDRLARQYGTGSPVAKGGRQRFFVNPLLETTYLALNTSRPLFSDEKLRQAVNYALDRRALARIAGLGSASAAPTDQFLPPGMPGFRDVHTYPFTPDLARAKRLARGRGGHAVLYACSEPDCRQAAQIVQANLRAIGLDPEVKFFPLGVMITRIAKRGEPYDAVLLGWVADYPDPADFLQLFNGASIRAENNLNLPHFDDPSYDRQLTAAGRLSGPRRYLAHAALDAYLARKAPIAALWNGAETDFFSARVGCQVYQPIYGVDLAALCIRRPS
jgi:YVTN family beta-propeller protein